MSVYFFSEEVSYNYPYKVEFVKGLERFAKRKKVEISRINYVFTSSNYMYELNQRYLKHKTDTDVITFDYSEEKRLSADVFISFVQVKENAFRHRDLFINELHRVMIHGVLHLIGYKDKTDEQKHVMRQEEQEAMSNYFKF